MTSDSNPGEGPSFCGNCGTPVQAGSASCGVCGQPVAETAEQTGPSPADYIPYCRSCGVGVLWGMGHTCQRCGVTPLCELHFRAETSLCLDCSAVPSYPGPTPQPSGGLHCGACGASVAPGVGFCSSCGRALAMPYAGTEYMGFWIRVAAYVVDWIVIYAASALIAALIGIPLIAGDAEQTATDDLSVIIENFNYNFLLLFCGMFTVYGILMTALRGQTLGKMLLRIQVVDAGGNIPPWPRAVARELLRGVISLALFPLGLLYLWIALDTRRRGLHDYLGGSYVVRKQRNAGPPDRGF